MTKLSFENSFLGAKIIKNEKEFYIYKINQKSFYYGVLEYEKIKKRWENKSPEMTWKSLMDAIGGGFSEYEGFFLSDKQEVEQLYKKASEEKKEKKYLSRLAEREIEKLFERYIKSSGSWRHQVEVSNEVFSIVEARKEGVVLLSFDGNFIFFNLNNKKYTFWKPIQAPKKGENTKEIPWPSAA